MTGQAGSLLALAIAGMFWLGVAKEGSHSQYAAAILTLTSFLLIPVVTLLGAN